MGEAHENWKQWEEIAQQVEKCLLCSTFGMNPFKTSLSLSDTLAILKTYLDCWLSLLHTKAWEVEADQCIWLIQEIHEVLELIAPWGFIFLISSLRFVQYALNIFTPTSISSKIHTSSHHLPFITHPSIPYPFHSLSLSEIGPNFCANMLGCVTFHRNADDVWGAVLLSQTESLSTKNYQLSTLHWLWKEHCVHFPVPYLDLVFLYLPLVFRMLPHRLWIYIWIDCCYYFPVDNTISNSQTIAASSPIIFMPKVEGVSYTCPI